MDAVVTRIIDGATFEVSPGWKLQGQEGTIVRAAGYNAPQQGESGYQTAKYKLTALLLGNEVELKKLIRIGGGYMICDVYYSGKNLAEYFSEYR